MLMGHFKVISYLATELEREMLAGTSVPFSARVFLSQLLCFQTHTEVKVICFILPKVLYKCRYL